MICFVCRFRPSDHDSIDMRLHWFLFKTQSSLWPVAYIRLLSPKRTAKLEKEEEQEEWQYICWRTGRFTFLKDHRTWPLVSRPWGKDKMGARTQGDRQWTVLRMTQKIRSLSVTTFRLNFYNYTEKSGLWCNLYNVKTAALGLNTNFVWGFPKRYSSFVLGHTLPNFEKRKIFAQRAVLEENGKKNV